MRRLSFMMFLDDTRFAIRQLRRTPVFAVTAILTLGLGLGLNTMLFTLFNAYLLRTAAVENPHSLYQLTFSRKAGRTTQFSWDQYQSIRSSPAFSDSVAVNQFFARLEGRNIEGQAVSGNYFTTLGVRMALGRFILPEDAPAPGGRPVAVLSNLTWTSQFAADPNIVGRKILINGNPFEVIGVCAAEFTGIGIDTPEGFYVPATMAKQVLSGVDPFGPEQPALFTIVGRLAGGVPVDSARAALTLAVRRATERLPESDRATEALLVSRATMLPLSPTLLAVFSPLIGAFLLILIVCCANVANMMLARAIARQREIGVRLALGANRTRLVAQLLSEGFLLAALSGAMASAVAFFSLRGAQRLLLSTLPATYASLVSIVPLHLDRNVLAFLVLAAGFVTIATSLAPALQATRLSLTDAMRGQFSAVLRPSRLRYALVVSQITICLVLLVITGVLMRSSASLQTTNTGFRTTGIVYPIFLKGRNKDDVNTRLAQYLAAQPWVDSVAAATRPPLGGTLRSASITLPGRSQAERVGSNIVSAQYFGMLEIPILRGRNFSAAEMDSEAPVAIVSEATARKLWPGEDPIGQTIQVNALGGGVDQPAVGSAVVIGTTKDVVSGLLIDGMDATMIYFPTSASAKRRPMLMIRARLESAAARQSLDAALKAAWPDRPSIAVAMQDGFSLQMYPFLAGSWIGFILGLIALALTVSGMYGVMSYLVSQRTKEIGIRMALGASPGKVVGLILRQSGFLAGVGIVVGLTLSLVIGKLLTSVFYMIHPFDAIAYGAGIGVVAVAALVSAFIPSRRASQIDPVETLRAE